MDQRANSTRRACLALFCAVASLMGIWLNLSGRSGVLVDQSAGLGRTFFYGARLASLVALFALSRPVWRNPLRTTIVGGSLIVSGTIARIIASKLAGGPLPAMDLLGYTLCGLGYIPCLVSVYLGASRVLQVREMLTAALVSILIKEQAPSLLALLGTSGRMLALWAILTALACSLMAFWQLLGEYGSAAARTRVPHAHRMTTYELVLGQLTGLTLFVFGILSSIGLVGNASSSATNGTILIPLGKVVAFVVCLLLGYLTTIKRTERPLADRYTPAFVVLAVSTAITSVAAIVPQGIFSSILISAVLMGVYDFNQFLGWAFVVAASHEKESSSIRHIALMLAVYECLAVFVGPIDIEALPPTVQNLAVVFGLMVAIVATAVVPFVIVRNSALVTPKTGGPRLEPRTADELDERGLETLADLERTMDERCLYIAQRVGLTSREAEVFCLLCRGKRRAAICEALNMSEGTVKTHIAHIYEKTNVHTRQDLADIVFVDL